MPSLPPLIYTLPKDCREEEFNEFKKYLINAVQEQASQKRIEAALCKRVGARDRLIAKSESYDYVVLMLQSIKFERNT